MRSPVIAEPERWPPDNRGHRLLDRAAAGFLSFWNFPLLEGARGVAGLFATLAFLGALRAYIGLIGTRDYSHDAFMVFDGAWRMINGQHPHTDFYSHLGFLTYGPTVVGLWLSHGSAWGFGYAQALVGMLLGLWVYWLGRLRLAHVPLVLMCLAVMLMSVAPFALGFPPTKVSPGMVYNRQGYGLIALLLVEAFESAIPSRNADFRGGVSTGVVLAILFFLKITYLVASLFLLVALIPCRTQTKQRWMGIAAGAAILGLLCCGYYGFHMKPLLHDLLTVGGGKHIRFGWYMVDAVFEDAGVAAILSLCAALLLIVSYRSRLAGSVALMGVAVAFAGLMLIFGNYEQTGFPLGVFLAILVIDAVNANLPFRRSAPDFFQVSVLLLGSMLIIGFLVSSSIGMVFAAGQRVLSAHFVKPLQSPILNGFAPASDDDWYSSMVNDGLVLVSKYKRPEDRIMSLDFTNPFSYGLGMKPAFGGTTVLQYGTTFNKRFKPSSEFLFGSADLVAVPKKPSDPTLADNLPKLYFPYLESHFRLIGESREWRLYRRDGE